MRTGFSLSLVLVSGLLLSGCGAGSLTAVPEAMSSATPGNQSVESGPVADVNIGLQACQEYTYVGGDDWQVAYELLIEDMCSQMAWDETLMDLRVGPDIRDDPFDFYVDGVLFQLNYLNSIAEGGIDVVPLVVVNEFDKDFFQENLEELVAIDFEWYSLSDAGGHCGYRYEAEGYCNNIYIPSETVNKNSVLTLFLGTEEVLRGHDTWRASIPAHSATHAVQYQKKMTHYTPWAIEGQALLHELVYQQLVEGRTVRFSKYFDMALKNDPLVLDPSSEQSIRSHIIECRKDGGQCLEFSSLAGSIYFEKLILDFGVQSYRDYFSKIWAATELEYSWEEFELQYAPQIFSDVYGLELESWLDEVGIPYLLTLLSADEGQS
jgi:hypothetical protein